jgi:assimilatory nitrate reductase catalytic subunit
VESVDTEGADKRVTGIRLVGETIASDWLKEVMTSGEFTADVRRWALAPLSAPPTGHTGRGKVVCSCLDVSENEIIDAVSRGADFITLQNKLKCGTQCGSCVPELKRLINVHGKN